MQSSKRFIDFVQIGIWLFVLLLFFQGKGSHAVFIAIAAIVPCARFMISKSFRNRVVLSLKREWYNLENFSHDSKIPVKGIFYYAAAPVLFFSLVNGASISSMDNYPTMGSTVSLINEGNLEISEMTSFRCGQPNTSENRAPYWIRCAPSGAYSAYPLGILTFAVPVTLLSKLLGGKIGDPTVQWRLSKGIGASIAAGCIAIFFLIALHYVPVGAAFVGTLFLTVGSAMLSTVSQGLWTHGGVIFGFLLALLVEIRPFKKTILTNLTQGACLAIMFACRLSSVALIIPFSIWLAFRSPRRAFYVGLAALVFHLPLFLYYWHVYGNIFGPQMQMGLSNGYASNPFTALLGILFSPSHGLFVYQPWILFGIFSLFVKKKSKVPKGWEVMLCLAICFHLAVISMWPCWWGGSCWGSRMSSEIIPLLALLILFPIDFLLQFKGGRYAVYFGILFSFLFHIPGVYMGAGRWNTDPPIGRENQTDAERLWDWSDPPFLYPLRRGGG